MHILFLTPNFPPEVNAAASRTYEHCRRWVESGHDVTVITPAPNWPAGKLYAGYRNRWRQEEDIEGVRVVRVWTWLHPNKGFVGRMMSFVSFMLHATWEATRYRNHDVMVATSPQFFCGQAGMLTHWITSLPFVLEIRDIWPESIVAVGAMRRSLAIRIVEWLEQRMYRSANHIVTVGEGYQQKLRARDVPAEKMTIASNGVDLDHWRPQSCDNGLRQRLKSEGKFVCTYVGTVGMAHGLEVILRAAAVAKSQGRDDVIFWIVGDGADRDRLQAESIKKGLDNVVLTGQVAKSEVGAIIASSDACLVHLRDTELFGTVMPSKIFEIMAMQTPIIMGVRGPAMDVVVDAQAGLAMIPEDELSLLDCVTRVQANSSQFTCGRRYVGEHFNRDQFAGRMLRVLSRVANGEPVIVDESKRVGDRELAIPKADLHSNGAKAA